MLLTIAVFLISALLWMVAVTLNIYRLARCFQIEGYDAKRYLHALVGASGEWGYLCSSVVSLAIAILMFGPGISVTLYLLYFTGIFAYLGLCVIAVIQVLFAMSRLKNQRTIYKVRLTEQTSRLLPIATFVALAYPFLLVAFLSSVSSWATNLAVLPGVWIVICGLMAILVAPFSLLLGSLIIRPVEHFFRHHSTAPTSQGSNL